MQSCTACKRTLDSHLSRISHSLRTPYSEGTRRQPDLLQGFSPKAFQNKSASFGHTHPDCICANRLARASLYSTLSSSLVKSVPAGSEPVRRIQDIFCFILLPADTPHRCLVSHQAYIKTCTEKIFCPDTASGVPVPTFLRRPRINQYEENFQKSHKQSQRLHCHHAASTVPAKPPSRAPAAFPLIGIFIYFIPITGHLYSCYGAGHGCFQPLH